MNNFISDSLARSLPRNRAGQYISTTARNALNKALGKTPAGPLVAKPAGQEEKAGQKPETPGTEAPPKDETQKAVEEKPDAKAPAAAADKKPEPPKPDADPAAAGAKPPPVSPAQLDCAARPGLAIARRTGRPPAAYFASRR